MVSPSVDAIDAPQHAINHVATQLWLGLRASARAGPAAALRRLQQRWLALSDFL